MILEPKERRGTAFALGERVGGRRLATMLLGFAGAMIVIRPGFLDVTLPVMALLYTTVAYGAVNAITRTCSSVLRTAKRSLWDFSISNTG